MLKKIAKSALKPDITPLTSARNNLAFLCIFAALLVAWQTGFSFTVTQKGEFEKYGIHHSCGASFSDPVHAFSYGLYYWGLFPVFPERSLLPAKFAEDKYFYSREGAKDILDNYGYCLRMDTNATFKDGNVMNLWFPYLAAIFRGTPEGTSYIPFNAIYFMAALAVLFVSFWKIGRGILGAIMVMVLGSYPFQLYCVYGQDNIFSYMISTIIMTAGIMARFIFDVETEKREQMGIVFLTGIFTGLAYLARTDCMSAFFSAFFALLFFRRSNVVMKGILIMVMCLAFYGTVSLGNKFFDYKFAQAEKIVSEKGGKTLGTGRLKVHLFWHTIWCGMCDFDTKYKHSWGDYDAEMAAKPVLETKYKKNVGHIVYHNRPVDYYLPFRIPEYDQAMKDLVIGDIKKDPAWYADIILKRAKKVLFEPISPLVMLMPGIKFFIPYNIFIFIAVLLILLVMKAWELIKLIIFAGGTAAIPMAVTTFTNYNYYSIVHLVISAVLVYIVIKLLLGTLLNKGAK